MSLPKDSKALFTSILYSLVLGCATDRRTFPYNAEWLPPKRRHFSAENNVKAGGGGGGGGCHLLGLFLHFNIPFLRRQQADGLLLAKLCLVTSLRSDQHSQFERSRPHHVQMINITPSVTTKLTPSFENKQPNNSTALLPASACPVCDRAGHTTRLDVHPAPHSGTQDAPSAADSAVTDASGNVETGDVM